MNYVLSIVNPEALPALISIHDRMGLPLSVVMHGRGTAVKSMLDLLGIESNEKRVVATIANQEKTAALTEEQKRILHIGVPGHGILLAVPIKSIGGGKTVAYLNGDNKAEKYTPPESFPYELIITIVGEGNTDEVMNAAREVGARGGTVLHGKGTGAKGTPHFYNITIAQEKEIVLIVASTAQKSTIMENILRKAGPTTKAGGIVFSLPISEAAGFTMFD